MREPREGRLVLQYSSARGWPLLPRNIMVEGEGDAEYFSIAARLYEEQEGRVLLGSELSVFCPGIGDDGGTYGILREFPVLRRLTDVDVSEDGKRLFRVVALLDGDPAGKGAFRSLTAKHTRLVAYQDVFLLHRTFPQRSGDPDGLRRSFEGANEHCRRLDCEIEDLLDYELVEGFLKEHPQYESVCRCQRDGGERHYSLAAHAKAPLRRYVRDVAIHNDVRRLIDALRAMRTYLGLSPDGEVAS